MRLRLQFQDREIFLDEQRPNVAIGRNTGSEADSPGDASLLGKRWISGPGTED